MSPVRRVVALVAVAGLSLLSASCSGTIADPGEQTATAPAPGDGDPDGPDATGGANDGADDGGDDGGGAGQSSTEVADEEHAVAPPGRRSGNLVPADLLVFNQEPLSDELVSQIDGLRRVERTERLSLSNVGVQNRVITVAAVDPGTYRNYTPYASAELQEAWDRVAGGELAVDPKVGRRIQDAEGYVKLGNDKDAEQLHIGAYAPQVPQVDAVVNEKWGEDLGMPLGNALLVTTGIHSPREVMKEVQRIVGRSAAVSILGPDLDPGAVQAAVLTGGSVAEAVGTFRYTVLGGGRIAPEQAWVAANIRTEPVPILGDVTCHEVVFPQLRAALLEVQQRGLAGKIHPDEYAGCYYPRYIAGTQQLSLHSFGIALDLNVPGNQRGTAGEIDRDVVAILKKWGFAWGGDWAWTDPMHFEMDSIVSPG